MPLHCRLWFGGTQSRLRVICQERLKGSATSVGNQWWQSNLILPAVLEFRNFGYDFWGVGGDVWRWLCRHLRRKNSAQTRERGLPSVLAEFIPSCWYIHHLNWDADLEKLRYKAGSLHQELLWHQNPVQLCPATTSVECYLCILCTFLWCYALGPLWWDVWPGL